ncbi:hypothetical protein [Brevibacillus aydinogluensis]|uniref:Uncharacterized protein n=1 Tax=Brevibacillus aydinogluensis TaxID=927786 RepID=A0AA48MAQ6_9BACL|nr:hypothetical protein [Brevibacillus aydinogluensis]CAJ1002762.1 hypothetical protein BSPP4475_10585 [Brevibacillus aydinogluensis]
MTDLYFAQIREDSMVERTLADRYRPKTVAVIGSGGVRRFPCCATMCRRFTRSISTPLRPR